METTKKRTKKRSIVRFRHKVVNFVLKPMLRAYTTAAFGYKAQKYRAKDQLPCIVLANHNCNFDPIFLALSFNFPIYFVASDNIFRLGFVSSLLKYLVAPIPILKSKTDTETIRTLISTKNAGGSIGLFPEGNRSYNGETGYIPPSTAKLLKMLGIPVLLYKIEGGYLSTPRWADGVRKGAMTGKVVRTLSREEIAKLSLDEINKAIHDELYENAFEKQEKYPVVFSGKNRAQYLERVLFLCPSCYGFASAKSHENRYRCSCGYCVDYDEHGFFQNHSSHDSRFSTVLEWDNWQREAVTEMVMSDDIRVFPQTEPIFSDDQEELYLCSKGQKPSLIGIGQLSLYPDRLVFSSTEGTRIFSFSEIPKMSLWGKQTLQFSTLEDVVYEFNSKVPRSGYKYMVLFHVLEQKRRGLSHGFFGI